MYFSMYSVTKCFVQEISRVTFKKFLTSSFTGVSYKKLHGRKLVISLKNLSRLKWQCLRAALHFEYKIYVFVAINSKIYGKGAFKFHSYWPVTSWMTRGRKAPGWSLGKVFVFLGKVLYRLCLVPVRLSPGPYGHFSACVKRPIRNALTARRSFWGLGTRQITAQNSLSPPRCISGWTSTPSRGRTQE